MLPTFCYFDALLLPPLLALSLLKMFSMVFCLFFRVALIKLSNNNKIAYQPKIADELGTVIFILTSISAMLCSNIPSAGCVRRKQHLNALRKGAFLTCLVFVCVCVCGKRNEFSNGNRFLTIIIAEMSTFLTLRCVRMFFFAFLLFFFFFFGHDNTSLVCFSQSAQL